LKKGQTARDNLVTSRFRC